MSNLTSSSVASMYTDVQANTECWSYFTCIYALSSCVMKTCVTTMVSEDLLQ